ncbi:MULTISPECIES: hypothetical protein [Bacillus cereus group]|uniref:Uncharacterized protein n=1 Tax=Bacillus thuringiensis TaxID=1428 RepID=A0A9X7FX75_BACTU|nr:hypothetical protein [Bacillus thuringiensis]MCQ6336224.1 hypothetical protein [Bacillus cereus]PFT49059.1 hypothetical protein COK72_06735 [Bacillus thuringiensis]
MSEAPSESQYTPIENGMHIDGVSKTRRGFDSIIVPKISHVGNGDRLLLFRGENEEDSAAIVVFDSEYKVLVKKYFK